MALCKFFRPVATPQPKRKRLRRMYQHDEELDCLRLDSPSTLSSSPGSTQSREAESAMIEDGDLVMKAIMRNVSLTDPFTLQLIESPVRGRDCEHIEAFDRRAFLDFNDLMERNRWCRLRKKWKCPFCDKHIRSSKDLVEAADVREVLEEAKLTHSDATCAILHPDGRLSLTSSKSPPASLEPVPAVDSDDEPSQQHDEPSQTELSEQRGKSGAASAATSGNAREAAEATSKAKAPRTRSAPKPVRKAMSKKEKKAALAAAKAAWERQIERKGSILSYCSNAKAGEPQTLD